MQQTTAETTFIGREQQDLSVSDCEVDLEAGLPELGESGLGAAELSDLDFGIVSSALVFTIAGFAFPGF